MIGFSLVLPVYNRQKLLLESVGSVISQTYPYWELIIIDDNSSDSSFQVAQRFSDIDERIHVVKNGSNDNKGASFCRNIGIRAAKYEYIIFLDSDDLLSIYCLGKRAKYIKSNPNCDAWIFNALIFKSNSDDLKILFNKKTDEHDLLRFLRIDTVWGISQPVWEKEFLLKISCFDENVTVWDDLNLNLKAFKSNFRYKFFDDSEPDCYYRSHLNTRMTNDLSLKSLNSQAKVLFNAFYSFGENNRSTENIRQMAGIIIENASKGKHKIWVKHFIDKIHKAGLISTYHKAAYYFFIFCEKKKVNCLPGYYRLKYLLLYSFKRKDLSYCRYKWK